MIEFLPEKRENPRLETRTGSAWGDIPTILKDLIDRFNVKQDIALEFGVEYGYSTSALANYFTKVIGVDTFLGDEHSFVKENHIEFTKECLIDFSNIELVQSDYKDFIRDNNNMYDLIHIDIVHNYEPTYECGEWAVQHAPIVIFHDTISFPEQVGKACQDLCDKFNLKFHNYPHWHGLGILVR